MIEKKFIDVNTPLTEEERSELLELENMSDDDIFFDEDCPPTIEEESNWYIYLMRKYNTRIITKEILELEKSQMTEEQRAEYDYIKSKKSYIVEVIKAHNGMTNRELKDYLKKHPYDREQKTA